MSNSYWQLKYIKPTRSDPNARQRTAQRLLNIRASLSSLRARKSDSTLLLATWNIRDFDSNKFGFGPRLPESFYYIAEIISCFDLVAIQEVARDLSALEHVVRILGREWDYIVTDTTEGASGNAERMAFVYNTEKVWFRRVAGEVVLPGGQLIVSRKKLEQDEDKQRQPTADDPEEASKAGYKEVKQQFARTPFVVAFQSGWFKFSLCTVHIYYGRDSGEKLKRRIEEIERLVKFFADRQDRQSKLEEKAGRTPENYILLGDFNVVRPDHDTMSALKSEGFVVPDEIDGNKVRKKGDHYYDQIAVRVKDKRFRVVAGGMVDIYKDVFRDTAADLAIYKKWLPKKDPEKNAKFRAKTTDDLYRKWRTWQLSDHAPLWIEIETDFADYYLKGIANG